MKRKLFISSIFFSLFLLLLYVSSLNRENYTTGSYKSTLFVDPAGYNVYLPATFQYGFKSGFPENIDYTVAYGFSINKDKKVITKFTYGVALLQSPFYITGLALCRLLDIPNTGYSPINHLIVDIAGIFYACLSLFLLIKLLNKFYSFGISLISSFVIFSGTNVLYYACIQPGMSHIYSFFLVVVSIYSVYEYSCSRNFRHFVLLCFSFFLIVLIRPINFFYIIPIGLFAITNNNELKLRLALLFSIKNIVAAIIIACFVFTPQLLYWKFAFGKFIADSYPGEAFSFFRNPQIAEFLFSPHNGLIPYNPIYFFLFATVVLLFRYKKMMFGSIILVSIIIIYLSASWHLFFFGCGFGARNFVELSCLFSFPLADFILKERHRFLNYLYAILVILSVIVNLKLISSWDTCFWGKDDWDWREYKYLLYNKPLLLEQDINSLNQEKVLLIDQVKAYKIDSTELYSPGINFIPNRLTRGYFKTASITAEVMALSDTSNAQFVCMGFDKDSSLFYTSQPIRIAKKTWHRMEFKSNLPFHNKKDYEIKIFILNDKKEEYYLRNLKVHLQ